MTGASRITGVIVCFVDIGGIVDHNFLRKF
jgi:hypothetical protein